MQAPADAPEISRQSLQGPDRISGQLELRANLDTVVAVLETPCAVRQWLPRVQSLQVLSRPDTSRTRIRLVTDFPWPWQDRVAWLEFNRQERADGVIISMQSFRPEQPEATDARPVEHSSARWQLNAKEETVRIDYWQRFTPGGAVPQWLSDKVAEGQVDNALRDIRALVQTDTGGHDCHWRPDPDNSTGSRPGG
jgi:hypothetical protein